MSAPVESEYAEDGQDLLKQSCSNWQDTCQENLSFEEELFLLPKRSCCLTEEVKRRQVLWIRGRHSLVYRFDFAVRMAFNSVSAEHNGLASPAPSLLSKYVRKLSACSSHSYSCSSCCSVSHPYSFSSCTCSSYCCSYCTGSLS